MIELDNALHTAAADWLTTVIGEYPGEVFPDGHFRPHAYSDGKGGWLKRTGWYAATTTKLRAGTAVLLLANNQLSTRGAKRGHVGATPAEDELDLVEALIGGLEVVVSDEMAEHKAHREERKKQAAGARNGDAPLQRERGDWETALKYSDKGAVTASLHNIITILGNHAAWDGVLAYDSFGNRVMMRAAPPWGGEPGPVTDADIVRVAAWLGRPDTYGITVGTTQVREALVPVAQQNSYHPVREYLDGLEWDGEERLPTFFRDFCGAAATEDHMPEYLGAVARCFFVSAVARVREPGCKADLMLILEGRQGAGKSTLVRDLAGADWFAEAMESPTSKDFYAGLLSRWVVEIAEMQSFNKAEVSSVKRAISVEADYYRPSYGHMAQSFPRQCVFVGTTNEGEYLRDPTGGRRFMPVLVGDVDNQAIRELRDQLWAEADTLYRQGTDYWTLPACARIEQDKRMKEDSWQDNVARYLHNSARWEVTVSEIMSSALLIEVGKHSRQDQMRVADILKSLGWSSTRKRVDGISRHVWMRPVRGADQ